MASNSVGFLTAMREEVLCMPLDVDDAAKQDSSVGKTRMADIDEEEGTGEMLDGLARVPDRATGQSTGRR
jgi:hypothetical protein